MQKFLLFARPHSAKVHRPPYFLPTESDLHAARKSFNVTQRIFLDLTNPTDEYLDVIALAFSGKRHFLPFIRNGLFI